MGTQTIHPLQGRFAALLPKIAEPNTPSWHLLPWLLLLAFVLRAAVALSGDFIVHPDEIMQYLEPAHALVFGNGILHWEYYYGARSWLVPGALAGILFLCEVLGLGEPAYYIPAVKLVLCAVSLLIPLCMYVIGRRLFGEATARAALLLGVFWYELVGFAHKPMTEFIATSLFLVLMVLVLRPRLSPLRAAAVSAFAVFVVAVRLQYAPLVGLLWLLPFVRGDLRARVLMVVAAVFAVCAVGLFDMLTWGGFLHPYWTVYRYNATLDEGRVLLEHTGGMYILWLLIASGGLLVPALLGVLGSRGRLFLLLLGLAVFIPHELQAHREYRYIYGLIPLWLLLCADVLCAGLRGLWQNPAGAVPVRWRQLGICVWAMVVSVAGIANALPGQARLTYHSHLHPENRQYPYMNRYLRGQDEVLALYRELAADPSVRGVHDNLRSYADNGGYYTLHHKVPLYAKPIQLTPADLERYVSHFIALPFTTVKEVLQVSDGTPVLSTEDGDLIALPAYISDATLNKLVYWSKDAQTNEATAHVLEDFVLVQTGTQYALWKATPSATVHAWKDYRVYLNNEAEHRLLEKAFGSVHKPPITGYGFEFAEKPEQQ